MLNSSTHFCTLFILILSIFHAIHSQPIAGVNLAGAEFDSGSFWPNDQDIQYFINKGLCLLRIPFKWERLQPTLGGDFDSTYWNNLNNVVNMVLARNGRVILDPHNYARYNGGIIGDTVAVSDYQDLWKRLANAYHSNPNVIFGLMNEPYSMTTELWLSDANAAISAIRGTGANNLILVPGNAWTGAHSWLSTWYGTANGEVMLGLTDSMSNTAIEVHQYFDSDHSGTNAACATTQGSTKISAFTDWARTNGFKAVLGEFGASDTVDCRAAVIDALSYMSSNSDVWLGWTWWAAGNSWGNYMYSIHPTNGHTTDKPQMSWFDGYTSTCSLLTSATSSVPTSNNPTPTSSNNPTPTSNNPTPTSSSCESFDVFMDEFGSGVSGAYSWATWSIQQTNVYQGTNALSFIPTEFEAIYIRCNTGNCMDTYKYPYLKFYLHGGSTAGQKIRITVRVGDDQVGIEYSITATNNWEEHIIEFTDLGSPQMISSILIQDHINTDLTDEVYVDSIQMLSGLNCEETQATSNSGNTGNSNGNGSTENTSSEQSSNSNTVSLGTEDSLESAGSTLSLFPLLFTYVYLLL